MDKARHSIGACCLPGQVAIGCFQEKSNTYPRSHYNQLKNQTCQNLYLQTGFSLSMVTSKGFSLTLMLPHSNHFWSFSWDYFHRFSTYPWISSVVTCIHTWRIYLLFFLDSKTFEVESDEIQWINEVSQFSLYSLIKIELARLTLCTRKT